MRFGRIRDDLDQFRDAGTVTADEVLSLFFDLCEDVREETGKTVDRLSVSSVDSLMKRLPWTGNTVRRIYQANAQEVLSPDRQRILEDVDRKLIEVSEGARKADEELEKTREQRTRLREKQEHLRETLKVQESTQAECGALQEQIGDLQKRILPELAGQKEFLDRQHAALSEKSTKIKSEIRETEEALERDKVQVQALIKERDRLAAVSDDRQREIGLLENDRKGLQEAVQLADSGVRELQEKIDALKAHLSARNYSALKEKQLADLEALRKAKADYEALESEHEKTVKELRESQKACESKLSATREEVAALQSALAQTRKESGEEERKAQALRIQQEEELTQLENERANQKLAAEARQLAIVQKKQQVDQEAEALLRREKDLEAELSQMSGERTAQRIEEAKRRIGVMQQVREELDAHYRQLLLSLGKEPGEVRETALFEETLDKTEADIMECGRLYRKLLRSLEGKTK